MKKSTRTWILVSAFCLAVTVGFFLIGRGNLVGAQAPPSTSLIGAQENDIQAVRETQSKGHNVGSLSHVPTNPSSSLAGATMLSAEGIRMVLAAIANGARIQDSVPYQEFLNQSVADHSRALEILKNEFDATLPSDVAQRSRIFGLMIEMTLAIAAQDSNQLDAFIQEAMPLIQLQVDTPSKVAVQMQSLSAAEIRQLTHLGPYTMQDGQLYANTFEPKFMAVGVLKEARSDLAKVYLSEIANSSSVDPLIRKVAAFHATEQGSTLRP